jgi:hypothetical protein
MKSKLRLRRRKVVKEVSGSSARTTTMARRRQGEGRGGRQRERLLCLMIDGMRVYGPSAAEFGGWSADEHGSEKVRLKIG